MAVYATELKIGKTIYTIKDLEAREALKYKADLVGGKISANQLPYTPVSNDDILELKATKADKDKLAIVAFSGNYNDLLNIPEVTITVDKVNELIDTATKDMATKTYVDNAVANIKPGTQGTLDYTKLDNKPSINGVILTGNLTTEQLNITIPELPGFPTIPTNVSAFTNDAGYISEETDPKYTAEKDALATKAYVSSVITATATSKISKKAALDINYTNVVDNTITLDITSSPHACVAAVLVSVEDGEEFVPLYSDNGVTRILRVTENDFTYLKLSLGSAFTGEWSGKLYLTQFIDTVDSYDTYQVIDSILHMVDGNSDGYPHFDTTNNAIILQSDNTTDIAVDENGILTITKKS